VVKQQTQTTIYRVPSDHPYFTAELSVRSTGPCDTDARVHYTFTSGDNRNSGQLAIGAERALHTWPHGNGDRVTLTFSANRACAPVLMVGFPAVHRWKISIL
jgi:hypothetical protein